MSQLLQARDFNRPLGLMGRFTFVLPQGKKIIAPNLIPDDGEAEYLKMITRADTTLIAAGGNFYIGLTSGTFTGASVLSDATANEPSAAGGYARQVVTRDATGWPTIDSVNGIGRAQTTEETFAASGADFDKSFTRAFLTEASTGSVGKLLGISAALENAVTVLDGNNVKIRYELFLRGTP